MGKEGRGEEGNTLFPHCSRADALRPHNAVRVFQLAEHLARVDGKVFVYDDLDFLVAFGLGDGAAGEHGDFGDGGGDDHVLQHGGADEAGRAGENEMHRCWEMVMEIVYY
jgi:hypothetical protein